MCSCWYEQISYQWEICNRGPILFHWSDLVWSVFSLAAGEKEQPERVQPALANEKEEPLNSDWVTVFMRLLINTDPVCTEVNTNFIGCFVTRSLRKLVRKHESRSSAFPNELCTGVYKVQHKKWPPEFFAVFSAMAWNFNVKFLRSL